MRNNKYINDYKKDHYKRLVLDVKKDKYEKLKAVCDEEQISVGTYLKLVIDKIVEDYDR